ncbi:hypothetical protein [Geminocystis herdmanii]|nr:hypothetical protein [Geminocystis herdmanii]
MHVISRKILRQFAHKYPDSEKSLTRWFKIVEKSQYILKHLGYNKQTWKN